MKPVRIGCSGWNYDDWKGRLYPESELRRRWLALYAERFDTVEVNSTFYRLALSISARGGGSQRLRPGRSPRMDPREEPRKLADDLRRDTDRMERRSEELGDEVEDVRRDWKGKRADPNVPGAPPEDRDERAD